MIDDKQREFLSQPHTARLTTICADGYPHVVPVWYVLDGDDFVIFTRRTTKKARNVQANSKAALSVGGDPFPATGYMVQGDAVVVEDHDDFHWASTIIRHYEEPALAEEHISSWLGPKTILLRLTPTKVVRIFG